ncbi:MAG: hypothetical protein P1U63_00155 [Coxiellaceae bacterium]|nr:hypothetical protein [Coxiellaceae bacterium]
MHTLTKRPSEYSAEALVTILSGNDTQLFNLSNINQCLDWIAKSDFDMLKPAQFVPVMAAMKKVFSELKKPDDLVELREQQQIIGNILMYLNRLLMAPLPGSVSYNFNNELGDSLARLVDYFLVIHQAYNLADDVRLFDTLIQLKTTNLLNYLTHVDRENFLMFTAQCAPKLSQGQCLMALTAARFQYASNDQSLDGLSVLEVNGSVTSSEAANIAALLHQLFKTAEVTNGEPLLSGLGEFLDWYDRDAALVELVPMDDIISALAELVRQCNDPALAEIDSVIECMQLFKAFDQRDLFPFNLTALTSQLYMDRVLAGKDEVTLSQLDSVMAIYVDSGECDQAVFFQMIYSYLEKAILFADEVSSEAEDILYCIERLEMFVDVVDATIDGFPDDFTAGMEALERFYESHPDVKGAPEPVEKQSMAQLLWQRGLLSPIAVPRSPVSSTGAVEFKSDSDDEAHSQAATSSPFSL